MWGIWFLVQNCYQKKKKKKRKAHTDPHWLYYQWVICLLCSFFVEIRLLLSLFPYFLHLTRHGFCPPHRLIEINIPIIELVQKAAAEALGINSLRDRRTSHIKPPVLYVSLPPQQPPLSSCPSQERDAFAENRDVNSNARRAGDVGDRDKTIIESIGISSHSGEAFSLTSHCKSWIAFSYQFPLPTQYKSTALQDWHPCVFRFLFFVASSLYICTMWFGWRK